MKGTDFYFTHADKKVEGCYGLGYVTGFSPNLPDFVVIGFDDDRGWELSACPYRFVGNDRYKTYFFAHVNEVRLISPFEFFAREHEGEEVFVDGIKGFIIGYNSIQESVIVGFKSVVKGWKNLSDDDVILAEYVDINVYLYVSMGRLTPHKYSPSNGDIVYVKFKNDIECIFIYRTKTSQDIISPYAGLIIEPNNNNKIFYGDVFVIDASDVIKIRPCTKEEKTKLLEGFEEENVFWDNKKTINRKNDKRTPFNLFYYIDPFGRIKNRIDDLNKECEILFKLGNYFTEEYKAQEELKDIMQAIKMYQNGLN